MSSSPTSVAGKAVGSESDTQSKDISVTFTDSKAELVQSLAAVRGAYGPKEKWRIWKNLFGVAIPFVLLFTALTPVNSLQSSLNAKNGLGPYSLAAKYTAACISSLFFLSFLLSKLPSKVAMVTAISAALLYIAAQPYPTFATLVPAAVLMGVATGLLWTALSNYVSRLCSEYAYITGEDFDIVLARFFGLFFFMYHTSGIWGNVVLAATIRTTGSDNKVTDNATQAFCGADYCPVVSGVTGGHEVPPQSTLNILFGSYFCCVLIGVVIMIFGVDSLSRYGEGCRDLDQNPSVKTLLLATLKQMMDPHQILLIPLLFFSTFQVAFFDSDFTVGYITCAWGIEHIGAVMVAFHVSGSISSFVFSRLIKYIGRLGVFSVIIVIHLAADISMLLWVPKESQHLGFFIIACTAGAVEGVLSAQLTGFNALIFQEKREAAFNNQRLWQGIGFIAAYLNTTLFCMAIKLYMMIAISIVGYVGYVIVEISYKRKNS